VNDDESHSQMFDSDLCLVSCDVTVGGVSPYKLDIFINVKQIAISN